MSGEADLFIILPQASGIPDLRQINQDGTGWDHAPIPHKSSKSTPGTLVCDVDDDDDDDDA